LAPGNDREASTLTGRGYSVGLVADRHDHHAVDAAIIDDECTASRTRRSSARILLACRAGSSAVEATRRYYRLSPDDLVRIRSW
jgi:hypothetical protein